MSRYPAIQITQAPRALLAALRRFNDGNGWILSSHVAMSILLALFPFILFVVALAGALSRDVNIDALVELIFGAWPDDIATPIEAEIYAVLAADSVGLMTLGGVLALYFASNGVDSIRLALSQAYRDDDPRPFWKTRALAILFVTVGGGLILGALTFGFGLPALLRLVPGELADKLADWATSTPAERALALSVLVFVIGACHVWLPGLRHSVREIWPGVVLTFALWIAAVRGFGVYVSSFADYSATYAGLAGAMGALIFLYLMAAILIVGAEFNGALIRLSRPGQP